MASIFQNECKKYYSVVREVHSEMFCFDTARIDSEIHAQRYICNRSGKIINLFSFIEILNSIFEKIEPLSGLDLGCGSHYFANLLSENKKWDLYGCDFDHIAISLAKRRFKKHEHRYFYHDILKSKLPFNDQSMNFVICNAVIQHFSHDECLKTFKEVHRVLAPNGVFLVIFKKSHSEPEVTLYDVKNYNHVKEKDSVIRFVDFLIQNEIMKRYDDKYFKDYIASIPKIKLYSLVEVLSIALISGYDIRKTINDYCYEFIGGKGFLTGAVFLFR